MTSTGALVGVGNESPDLMAALRRQWMTIVIAALVGASAAWLYASTQPVVHESTSTLLLIAAGDEATPGGGRNRTLDVDTWATVARSTELLQRVSAELGIELDLVRTRSTATAAPTGDVLVLTFEAPTVDEAIEGAAIYSREFLDARGVTVNASTLERRQQLEDLAEDLANQIADLDRQVATEEARGEFASDGKLAVLVATQQQAIERLAEIDDELGTLDTNVETGRIIINPETAVDRVGLGVWLTTLSGLLVGALLGLILALLRDRYDDRYSSAPEPEVFGLREIGRVPYAIERGRKGRNAMLEYSRLITRLTFARRGERSVLLLPVESETLPLDAAQRVAAALEECGMATGISTAVWADAMEAGRTRAHWEATIVGVQQLRSSHDLVLVPETPLDQSALGVGLAALVNDTLLIVSDKTPMRLVQLALEDLRGVNVDQVEVIVLTGIRSRHLRTSASV